MTQEHGEIKADRNNSVIKALTNSVGWSTKPTAELTCGMSNQGH